LKGGIGTITDAAANKGRIPPNLSSEKKLDKKEIEDSKDVVDHVKDAKKVRARLTVLKKKKVELRCLLHVANIKINGKRVSQKGGAWHPVNKKGPVGRKSSEAFEAGIMRSKEEKRRAAHI